MTASTCASRRRPARTKLSLSSTEWAALERAPPFSVVTIVTAPGAMRRYISAMKPKHILYLLGATLAYFTIAVFAARPVWAGY